jgi:DivIVA domain-containing protein
MNLDRAKIERTDFASARRGYEPAEVDAHLREVADAVEDLRGRLESQAERSSTLSGAASERLRVILDAAEASATEIRSEAEEEARETAGQARQEARSMTEEAERRARQREEEAERRAREREEEAERRAREREEESEAASAEQAQIMEARVQAVLSRADSLDIELEAMLDRMRAAAGSAIESLRGEAEALRSEVEEGPSSSGVSGGAQPRAGADEEDSDVSDTVVIEPAVGAEPSGVEAVLEPEPGADEAVIDEELVVVEEEDVLVADEDEASVATTEPSAPQTPASGRSTSTADAEGARLIALNMALSGSPRSETTDYLRETFGLQDDALLDDVYQRVQAS